MSGHIGALITAMLAVLVAALGFVVGRVSWRFLRGVVHESARRKHDDDDGTDEMVDIADRLSQVLPVPTPPPQSAAR